MEPLKAIVIDRFEKGINRNDPGPLGYHGTSVHALVEAMRTGSLPVTKGAGGVFGGQMYKGVVYGIHIVPNPLNPVVRRMEFRRPLHEDPFADALAWARFIAQRHHLMKTRGLDLGRISHHRAADDIMNLKDPSLATRKLKLLSPDADAPNAGVVLAISQEAAGRFRIGVGGDGNDINVMTKALPLDLVTGIEPADDEAFRWLDTLGSKNESFSGWLSYKENPLLRRVSHIVDGQRRRLERRYGKKRADRIIATALFTGLIPLPGIQVAAVLAMLGISEAQRITGGLSTEEERELRNLEKNLASLN